MFARHGEPRRVVSGGREIGVIGLRIILILIDSYVTRGSSMD